VDARAGANVERLGVRLDQLHSQPRLREVTPSARYFRDGTVVLHADCDRQFLEPEKCVADRLPPFRFQVKGGAGTGQTAEESRSKYDSAHVLTQIFGGEDRTIVQCRDGSPWPTINSLRIV